jgi:predicted acetyltransferase
MTDLIETQLRDMSEDGLTVAVLKASEAAIWRRFGYGVSTRARTCSVNRRTARLRREVPADGQIELLSDTDAKQAIPRIYAGLAEPRAGMITRTPYWWAMAAAGAEGGQAFAGPITTVVHHGPAGPDGFAIYLVRRAPAERTVLRIVDMHTSGSTAFGALWRYLLGVDLVDEIAAPLRPTDEPIELLFTDQRVCQTTSVSDERWLRLIDVPAALTTRAYQGEAVVIEVTDPLLVQNCGTYRVGAEGVQRTGEPAQLQLDVASLADIYLGAWRPSMLAQGGLIGVRDPAALAAADRLFAGSAMPWCGTILL